jgi:hypothetical protein
MKVMRVYVSPELITEMFTTDYELKSGIKVKAGLPEGAVLTAIGWDVVSRCWAFDFYHSGWADVELGHFPPTLSIVVETSRPVLGVNDGR